MPTPFEADSHTYFQASVAITYGVLTGRAVYFLDSSQPLKDLVSKVRELMN